MRGIWVSKDPEFKGESNFPPTDRGKPTPLATMLLALFLMKLLHLVTTPSLQGDGDYWKMSVKMGDWEIFVLKEGQRF